MKGEKEVRDYVSGLEELLSIFGSESSDEASLRALTANCESSLGELRKLLGPDGEMSEEHKRALQPLLCEAMRRNAEVMQRAKREADRVEEQLSKVRRSKQSARSRGDRPATGASCDVSG